MHFYFYSTPPLILPAAFIGIFSYFDIRLVIVNQKVTAAGLVIVDVPVGPGF